MNKNTNDKSNAISLLKFIIPSLIGVILFMTPIKIDGQFTIPIAFLANFIVNEFAYLLPVLAMVLISASAIGSIIFKLFKPNNSLLNSLFNVNIGWFCARIIGCLLVLMTYFKIGPEFIWSDSTGGTVLYSLLPTLVTIFLLAGLFLPLLLNHGLLEFVGALLTKIMRPLFNLPGRSSIDCITSWLGDGTIGILLTSKQYEDGFYTKKEAAIVGTTFSAVSITFCLMVISQVGLAHMFVPFYLTVTAAGIVAAIILPRIYPLCKKPNEYINGKIAEKNSDAIPKGYTSFSWGLENAIKKAKSNSNLKIFFVDGLKNVFDMWLGVLPIVMALGGIALMIAEYTNIFQILGSPFIPFLKLLGVPEAIHASQCLIVGFADMFIPSVLATTIQSEMTRFIIACVSVTQLIYMSEVGGLLLGSKIPVNFKDLVILFLERTLITLPVIVLFANIIF